MTKKETKPFNLFLLILLLFLPALACNLPSIGGDSDRPPRNAVVVEVLANSSLTPWLETAVADFNAAKIENSEGSSYFAILHEAEAGLAVTQLRDGPVDYALWLPDDPVWTAVLAEQGNSDFRVDCLSTAQSPLVIAMWRPIAESLGWPGLPLGWLDVGSLAADPVSWNYYSGGELGDNFRLGHTHPGLSATGASTLLAVVQAARLQTEGVTVADVQLPIVQASVGAFESGVAWFGNSTANMGRTMSERDMSYLSAVIVYESTVVQYGGGEIVAVYPFEGTFLAEHPACVNQGSPADAREGALAFREYLLSEPAQQAALAVGLRPANTAVSLGPPLDETHGVNPQQQLTIFDPPLADTIFAVQELWQQARKDVNLVMVLDISGSMRGNRMRSMQTAATQFVQQMGDDDRISLITFSSGSDVIVRYAQVGENRQKVIADIQALNAFGSTALYDAIGDGAALIAETTAPDMTNILVVLTDGEDNSSNRYSFNQRLFELAAANDTTVVAIAYSTGADARAMEQLATATNGIFYLSDEASIEAIYDEMSAAFGGTAGVGR
jgi:Ca-activated chloride channel homolog